MIMILRYILLVGDHYYPNRWKDYVGEYATQEAAETAGKTIINRDPLDNSQWWQVIDLMTKEVVAHS